jgi:uncharacterized protein with HEPN domain
MTNKHDRRKRDYLLDILDSIDVIAEYIDGYSLEKFLEDTGTQDSVIRRLTVIGEAANNLPESFTALYPEVDWRKAADMRNFLVHEYFGISLKIVWNVAVNILPVFKKQIEKILKDLG